MENNDTKALKARMNKVIGQLNGINKMLEENAVCTDVLIQLNAAKSAIHKIGQIVLERHINHCVRSAIKRDNIDKTLDELADAIEHFSRI